MNTRINNSFIYLIGALGGLLFGYDTGIISGAILFITDEFRLSSFMEGVVVSSILVGAMIGSAFSGIISDKLGRRKIIMAAAITFCFGSLGCADSPSIKILIAFRILLGIAVGGASTLVPMYLSEIAPPQKRGALSSINQLMITIGILFAYFVSYGFSAATGGWRWMLGFAFLPSAILLIGILFLPESPRWLLTHGREAEGRQVLNRLRNGQNIELELNQIYNANVQNRGSLKDLALGWARPALVIGVGLAFFQQIIGCNTVIYYAPTIIASMGLGKSAAIFGTVLIGLINVLITLVAMKLIDRIGRKKLLLIGNVGMIICLLLLWLFGSLFAGSILSPVFTVLSLGLYIIFFGVSWGPVVWVMLGEIFPLHFRGVGIGLSSMVNWLANLLVALTFPVLLQKMGTLLFILYAITGLLAFLFVKKEVIETSKKSLEQIELELHIKSKQTSSANIGRGN